jgi:hypothetical protein
MEIDDGAVIMGLKIEMRPALMIADQIWHKNGRDEGVTITCGLNGEHSAGSLHYYGYAVDLRTKYWLPQIISDVAYELQERLKSIDKRYGVQVESNHIHVQWKPDDLW